ncbi:MAG: glycosyltransferase [Blautia sp.]
MKVLILSCRTGGGHDAAGMAMKEELNARGHEAVLFDYLTLAGQKVSDRVGDIYVNTVKKMPHVFGAVYQLGMVVSRITRKSPVYYVNSKMGKYLEAYLEEEQFDAILMPHLYPAETITYMKRKGAKLPLTVAIMTDYTCIPFWEETECDYYIVPHEELIKSCVKRGIPKEKLVPLGIPVSRRFRQRADKEKARAYLNFPKDKKICLLMGGSMGAGDLERLTEKLLEQAGEDYAVAVVCGSNKKIFLGLKKKYKDRENLYIIGKTNQMEVYMKACDIIYTKPGGLTSTEAAVSGIPIIHTAPIPGCESANRRFFVRQGMSLAPRTTEAQVREGIRLLDDKERVEAMKKAQKACIKGDSGKRIADFLEDQVYSCPEVYKDNTAEYKNTMV